MDIENVKSMTDKKIEDVFAQLFDKFREGKASQGEQEYYSLVCKEMEARKLFNQDLLTDTKVQAGQTWIYLQSLRKYEVVEVKDGNVHYTTKALSPSFGKIFIKTRTEFLEKFVKPEDLTEEMKEKSLKEQLRMQGIIK